MLNSGKPKHAQARKIWTRFQRRKKCLHLPYIFRRKENRTKDKPRRDSEAINHLAFSLAKEAAKIENSEIVAPNRIRDEDVFLALRNHKFILLPLPTCAAESASNVSLLQRYGSLYIGLATTNVLNFTRAKVFPMKH